MLWWTDDLKIGIDSIDNQHKSIFDKSNEVFNLGIESDIYDIEKVFTFLMNYATNHFYEEEAVMIECKYDNFLVHRNQHNYFIEEIYKIYQNIINNNICESNLNDLKVLIIEWLANHINFDDRQFIELIKNKQYILERETKNEIKL